MPDECVSRLRIHFLKEVWRFNKKNHEKIEDLLKNVENVQVIKVRNYRQAKEFYNHGIELEISAEICGVPEKRRHLWTING